MEYNTSFLVAALVCLLLIIYHYIGRKRVDNISNHVFTFFIIIGTLDVFFDYICTLMMMAESPKYKDILVLLLTLLFLMQVMFPYGLYLYVQSLRNQTQKFYKLIGISAVPAIIMGIIVLLNVFTGSIFRVTDQGVYVRGPLYIGVYLYALAYGIIILAGSLIHYKELGLKKLCVIWEFAVLMCVCVIIQGLHNELLTTGYGISLGMMILFLTLHHPSEYTDVLTGAFNIQCFLEWSREQFSRKRVFHIISVDLHQLKEVNTIFGTDSGDFFLREITKSLQEILGTSYIFRISSKRLIMATFSLAEYEKVRNQTQDYLKGQLMINGEPFQISAVICGITNADNLQDGNTLLSYISYLASIINVYDSTRLIQSSEQTYNNFQYSIEIEQYLRTAIEEDLFEVYYQPVFSLEKGRYLTLEALSRLRHPNYGPISPDIFITIAERNGLISQLGYLQFRRICRFVDHNRALLDKIDNIKFNLSPADLLRSDFVERYIQIIREFNLPFTFFQFEITETIATEYSENLYHIIDIFKKYGIGLCLDDFGSGYANLDSVLKLPISSIKMDRSLLNNLLKDQKSRLFYKNITTLFRNMGYSVIAEGVEHEEELELLKEWNINLIQGYFFSKPLNEKDTLRLILNID